MLGVATKSQPLTDMFSGLDLSKLTQPLTTGIFDMFGGIESSQFAKPLASDNMTTDILNSINGLPLNNIPTNGIFDMNTLTKPQIGSIDAPLPPPVLTPPNLNTDTVSSANDDLKAQNNQIQQENAALKEQLAKIMDILSQNSLNTTGGLRDLINVQKKGNSNLDTIAGNII